MVTGKLQALHVFLHVLSQNSPVWRSETANIASPEAMILFPKQCVPLAKCFLIDVNFCSFRLKLGPKGLVKGLLIIKVKFAWLSQGLHNSAGGLKLVWPRLFWFWAHLGFELGFWLQGGLSSFGVFSFIGICSHQPLKLQLLCKLQKSLKLLLDNAHLPEVDELHHGLELVGLEAPHVDEWVLVFAPLQQPPEEGAAGGENHLVGLQL